MALIKFIIIRTFNPCKQIYFYRTLLSNFNYYVLTY